MSLLLSLAAVGAILLAVTLAGAFPAAPLLPPGSAWRPERWGWAFAIGCALVALETAAALALGVSPGWLSFLAAALLATAVPLFVGLQEIGADVPQEAARPPVARRLLLLLLASAVGLYLLRALTEPMWSNDYLAIWGLKAKTIFLARALPRSLWPGDLYGFSHPEYPLGLPLLLAGLASFLGRWDDQALALLFPFFQAATLLVLFGWLRRRGAPWPLPLAAVALLASFEPLYSAYMTGMAEVPISCAILLFGTAFSDALDGTDSGALRRLALASCLVAGTKNEGLFLAFVGAIGALVSTASGRRRWPIAAAALIPAASVAGLSRLVSGNAPLRDFDFGLLGPRVPELPARLAEAIRTALLEMALPAWPVLLCLALLFAAGRRAPFADRLLWLAAACLAAYLLLPTLAARGPAWLVLTTLPRTVAALAPLVAAGMAGRLATVVNRKT